MSRTLKSEIEARNELFRQATVAGDAAKVAALYTEEAWLLPHGVPIIRGKRDIERYWQEQLSKIAEVRLQCGDVVMMGPDHAREVGASTIKLKGRATTILGKYIVVWARTDGEWRLEADAFNGDLV